MLTTKTKANCELCTTGLLKHQRNLSDLVRSGRSRPIFGVGCEPLPKLLKLRTTEMATLCYTLFRELDPAGVRSDEPHCPVLGDRYTSRPMWVWVINSLRTPAAIPYQIRVRYRDQLSCKAPKFVDSGLAGQEQQERAIERIIQVRPIVVQSLSNRCSLPSAQTCLYEQMEKGPTLEHHTVRQSS